MSGGKGGSSSTEIPEWLKEPLLRNITRAEAIQSQEFTPYQGPEVAAFSPMQVQAMRNVGSAAEAFGMMPMGQGEQYVNAGINAPQTFAGGIRGYSSMPLYSQAQARTAATPEGQGNLAIREQLYSQPVVDANLERFKRYAMAMPQETTAATTSDNGGDGGDMGGDGGDLGDSSVGGIGGDAGDSGDFGGYA
jgi:hypothetical protein